MKRVLRPGLVLFLFMTVPPLSRGEVSKAGKGMIEGKVLVTAPARPEEKAPASKSSYPGYSGTSNNTLSEEIVVYLEKVKGTWPAPKKHARLDQKYTQFTHRVVPVLVGTSVDFTNNDPVYHNVFSSSETNKFDLGRRKKGETVTKKMTKVEVPVPVYCEIHRKMTSNILVLQNPFFTVVGPGGSFKFRNVPAGTYRLAAWHDHWEPTGVEVTVKDGKTAKAELTLDKTQE